MYKGFKNRETWMVNHHLQNTEVWYRHYKYLSSLIDGKALADTIKLDISLIIPDNTPLLLRDLMEDVLGNVEWAEVAASFYE